MGEKGNVSHLLLSDGLFNTHVLKDKKLNSSPFLRVDMRKRYRVKTIIFDVLNYDGLLFLSLMKIIK